MSRYITNSIYKKVKATYILERGVFRKLAQEKTLLFGPHAILFVIHCCIDEVN
jgi:hypothetical protein